MNENIRYCECGCGGIITGLEFKRFLKNHGNNIIEHKCQCGCGKTFKDKANSKRKYIEGHFKKYEKPLSSVIIERKCGCGCGQILTHMDQNIKFLRGHGKNIIRRECECGCGEFIECEAKSKRRFINGHQNNIRKGKKMEEFLGLEKARTLKHIKDEKRYCECGCGESFYVAANSKKRFQAGHQNRNQGIERAKETDIIYCECGCGERILWNSKFRLQGWPRFINLHQNNIRKGKTYDDLYDKEKAERLRQKPEEFGKNQSERQLGVTMVERIGEEKAKIASQKQKISSLRSYEERCGKEKADEMKQQRIKARLGKSYIEIFGEENALKISEKKSESISDWGKGKNEIWILDYIEKMLGYIIERHKYIYIKDIKQLYKPDGYIKELKLFIEVDEKYHNGMIEKDKIREENIKRETKCSFLRIHEKNALIKMENDKPIKEVEIFIKENNIIVKILNKEIKNEEKDKSTICITEGCNEKAYGRNLCKLCYHKVKYQENKERVKLNYQKNLEERRKKCLDYYYKNKEKIKLQQKEKNQENKEKGINKRNIYYKKNKDKLNEKRRENYNKNKNKSNEKK